MTNQRLWDAESHHALVLLLLIVSALTILALIIGRGLAILALVPAGTDVTAGIWTFTGALYLVALWPLVERRRAVFPRRVLAVELVVVLVLIVLALTLIIAVASALTTLYPGPSPHGGVTGAKGASSKALALCRTRQARCQ